jgi:capsular polysaccharide transport system permease protein
MDLEFATDLYRSSLAALEGARVEASRKLKHLIVIESPSLPEEALYPRRLYSMTTLLVFLVLLYGIGRLTAATIKDHKD